MKQAVAAMTGLTYGLIEAGAAGPRSPTVLGACALAVLAAEGFGLSQARAAHPMVPPSFVRHRNVAIPVAVGFAFMVGYFGLPFVMSLDLQQRRGLSSLATGAVLLPMMLIGLALTPFSARLAERVGGRLLIVTGLATMAVGLGVIALLPTAPVTGLALLMVLVGLAGPLVMPPVTAVLLNSVLSQQGGTASGLFNTSRQVGGALAVAVFGALLAGSGGFLPGMRTSLLIAALVAVTAAALLPARRLNQAQAYTSGGDRNDAEQ